MVWVHMCVRDRGRNFDMNDIVLNENDSFHVEINVSPHASPILSLFHSLANIVYVPLGMYYLAILILDLSTLYICLMCMLQVIAVISREHSCSCPTD